MGKQRNTFFANMKIFTSMNNVKNTDTNTFVIVIYFADIDHDKGIDSISITITLSVFQGRWWLYHTYFSIVKYTLMYGQSNH